MCERPTNKLQTIAESLNNVEDDEDGFFMSRLRYNGFGSPDESSDLELAAEIGKALLERNHELEMLLKSTQDFAEEEATQSMHLSRQVELLRESNESKSRLCQQLDNQFQELNERHAKLKAEHWTLQGRYRKAYETSEVLEKKCEELKDELEKLREEKANVSHVHDRKIPDIERFHPGQLVYAATDSFSGDSEDLTFNYDERDSEIEALKDELDSVFKSFLDTQDKLECETKRREDLENEVSDALHENDLLRQRTVELENEILEWQDVATRAEQYQKLADRYCSGWDLSSEDPSYTVLTFDTKLINVNKSLLSNDSLVKEESKIEPKDESSETLVVDRDVTPTLEKEAGHSDLQGQDKAGHEKSSLRLELPDNRANNLSLLSELDTQYKEMVKRYEALLEKCRYEGKISDDPVRTRKVQRAIQTLSLDLSYITSPLSPSSKTLSKEGKCPRCSSASGSKSQLSGSNDNLLDQGFDYRMMFAEIFTKLKESKDYDPSRLEGYTQKQ